MKYKEVKEHYESGQLYCHYSVDESGSKHGEYRSYHWNEKVWRNCLYLNGSTYGEMKRINSDGDIDIHRLLDGKGNVLATVVNQGEPVTHSEEQLIEIAKEHNLPLLSEIPKTEAEVTLWNLKYPDLPRVVAEFQDN